MSAPEGPTAAGPGPGEPASYATLGRLTPGDDGSSLVEVHLLGLPLHVMRASREHHDGLMREFRLLALSGELPSHEPPARLMELVEVLGQRFGTSRERRDAELDAAIAAGREVEDQVVLVPAAAAQAAVALDDMLAEADAYCEQALLITVPRPPLVKRFGQWYVGQFVDQAAGEAPVPWDGPLRAEG